MYKLIIVLALVMSVFSIHSRTENHLKSQSHFLNGQLCKQKGGIVCGFVDKDCCAKGCDSKLFGLNEVCVDGKELELNAQSCETVCTQKGGVTYNDKLLSDVRCCQKSMYKDGNCPEKARINLGACNQDTIADKIVGLVSHSD